MRVIALRYHPTHAHLVQAISQPSEPWAEEMECEASTRAVNEKTESKRKWAVHEEAG